MQSAYVLCLLAYISLQVNLYVPIVTNGIANAANGALTTGRVCAAPQK